MSFQSVVGMYGFHVHSTILHSLKYLLERYQVLIFAVQEFNYHRGVENKVDWTHDNQWVNPI